MVQAVSNKIGCNEISDTGKGLLGMDFFLSLLNCTKTSALEHGPECIDWKSEHISNCYVHG